MVELTIGIAAIAGLGSFLAPCILPMIPAFLAYISGTTLTELQKNNGTVNLVASRLNIILNTLFFVAGFTIVFSVLGVILNSVLSASAGSLLVGFNHVGGIIIIAFGVFMLLSSKIHWIYQVHEQAFEILFHNNGVIYYHTRNSSIHKSACCHCKFSVAK